MRFVMSFAWAIVLVGCATSVSNESEATFVAPDHEKRVLEPAEKARFDSWLDEIQSATEGEDYEYALEVIQEALSQAPPPEYRRRLQAARVEAKTLYLRRSCLDSFVRINRKHHEIGEVIRPELVLMNISTQTITITAQRLLDPAGDALVEMDGDIVKPGTPVTARSVLRISTRYREFHPNGTSFEVDKHRNVHLDREVVLESGESLSIPIEIDTTEINPSGNMYRTYTLRCSLYPAEVKVGDEPYGGRLDFREATVSVFPRNYQHLLDDPVARVKQSLEKKSALHLTLASALVDKAHHESVFDLYEKELARREQSEAMTRAIWASLRIMTGLDLSGTAGEWTQWLKDRNK